VFYLFEQALCQQVFSASSQQITLKIGSSAPHLGHGLRARAPRFDEQSLSDMQPVHALGSITLPPILRQQLAWIVDSGELL